MNELEVKRNQHADDLLVLDLNKTPVLPYADESFDLVTFRLFDQAIGCNARDWSSVEARGMVILSTSDKCFPTKVVRIWSRTNDLEHILIYGSYIHLCEML